MTDTTHKAQVNGNDMNGTFTAQVVVFELPNGRRKEQTTELPLTHKARHDEMVSAGYRFEAEILRTNHVSVTISNDEGDIDFSITSNGPEVQAGMCGLLDRFPESRAAWESTQELA